MAEDIRWHKAVVISLFLHTLVLPIIGCLAVNIYATHEVQEQWVELELISDLSEGVGIAENLTQDSAARNGSNSMFAFANQPQAAAAVGDQRPSVQTVTGSMPVQAVETGDNINTVANGFSISPEKGSGTGTGNRTGMGSGEGTGLGSGSGASNKERGGELIPPGISSQVEPDYPEQARQAGQAGIVVLKIQILENGRPGQVSVYHSSGFDLLDAAAVDAVRQWRFIPAKERESGQPVVCYTTRPVVFRLRS